MRHTHTHTHTLNSHPHQTVHGVWCHEFLIQHWTVGTCQQHLLLMSNLIILFLVKSHNIPSLLIRITCIWKRISQSSKKMILLIHRDPINMPLMLDLLHSAPLCYIYYILVYVWAHVCRLSGSVGMALDFMIHIEYPCHSSCFLLLLFSQVLHHISLFI